MADKPIVAEWLRYANMDFATAKFDFENMHPAPLEIICYHCQQAAEKFLKAIIIDYNKEAEKTHDLQRLTDKLKSFVNVPNEIMVIAARLTQYAVHTRYPDEMSVDENQTKNAISQAEQVKIWAEKIIADKSKDDNT